MWPTYHTWIEGRVEEEAGERSNETRRGGQGEGRVREQEARSRIGAFDQDLVYVGRVSLVLLVKLGVRQTAGAEDTCVLLHVERSVAKAVGRERVALYLERKRQRCGEHPRGSLHNRQWYDARHIRALKSLQNCRFRPLRSD